MRDFFEALMQASIKTGVPVVVVGGQGAAPGGYPSSAPLPPANEAAIAEIAKLRGDLAKTAGELRVKTAEAEMQGKFLDGLAKEAAEMKKRLESTPGAGPDIVLVQERDTLRAKVSELQGHISSLQTGGATVAPGAGNPGAAEKSIMDYPVDILGIDPKVLKNVEKAMGATPKTVGEIHTAMLAGKFKAKKRGVEDPTAIFKLEDILDIAHKLMGRVPPAHRADTAAPANGTNGAHVPAGSGDLSIPAGHNPRKWAELIEAARKKEKVVAENRTAIAQLTAQLERFPKEGQTDEVRAATTKIIGDPLDRKDKDSLGAKIKVQEMYEGQFLALLYAAGFDTKKLREKFGANLTVDQALQEYGLVHLMAGTPAPVGA